GDLSHRRAARRKSRPGGCVSGPGTREAGVRPDVRLRRLFECDRFPGGLGLREELRGEPLGPPTILQPCFRDLVNLSGEQSGAGGDRVLAAASTSNGQQPEGLLQRSGGRQFGDPLDALLGTTPAARLLYVPLTSVALDHDPPRQPEPVRNKPEGPYRHDKQNE